MAELQHDRRLVQNLAVVHEASATIHLGRARQNEEVSERSHWSQDEMLAASGFAVAASYWSLIDPRRALVLHRKASEVYRSRNHSYGLVLALASADRDGILGALSEIDESPSPTPQSVAFAMIANEVSANEGQSVASASNRRYEYRAGRLVSQWQHAGNVPVGRLGVPLDHYVNCAKAMQAARVDGNTERFFEAAADYVQRAAEAMRNASHDRFHWMQLRSAVLPAEPEAVAMTTAMSIMSHSMFNLSISEIPRLDAHGRTLVELGEEMRSAAIEPDRHAEF